MSPLDPQFPTVRFNDGAAAQARGLGRIEGIEYFVQMDFVNADTGIVHPNSYFARVAGQRLPRGVAAF